MTKTKYSYDDARAYCEEYDLIFAESWVPAIDKTFDSLKLSQEQVDRLMREYIWRVHYLFSPRNYSFLQRLQLAIHFLFKKKL